MPKATKKQTGWAEKLRMWRQAHEETYARAILSPPQHTTLYRVIPKHGVLLVLGDLRKGKSAMAHEIMHQLHERRGMAGALHLPQVPDKLRKEVQKMLPKWVTVATDRSQWPQNAVIVYDETSQSAHARRSQSNDAVELDNLMGISGQRRQLIVFITHHSRKIDINVLRGMPMIIWKEPTTAHAVFEREELQDFVWRALEFFRGLAGAKAKLKASLVLDYANMVLYTFNNGTPPWWTEDLSRIFQSIKAMNGSVIEGGKKKKGARR